MKENNVIVRKSNFNKVTDWLEENKFQIKREEFQDRYEATVNLPPENIWFRLVYSKDRKDSFTIQQKMGFTELDSKAFLQLPEKRQQEYFMNIRRAVFPLGVNCDTRYPNVMLHKMIFFDTTNNKQVIFDYIFNFINAMALCMMEYDKLRLELFPNRSSDKT